MYLLRWSGSCAYAKLYDATASTLHTGTQGASCTHGCKGLGLLCVSVVHASAVQRPLGVVAWMQGSEGARLEWPDLRWGALQWPARCMSRLRTNTIEVPAANT
jgi:hypothetical protein